MPNNGAPTARGPWSGLDEAPEAPKARPGVFPDWGPAQHHVFIELEKLTDREIVGVVLEIALRPAVWDELRERVREKDA